MADDTHRSNRRPFEPAPPVAPVSRGERPWPETGPGERRREPLPEPKLPELRRLVRKVCALEARDRGEDVMCLSEGALPSRVVGMALDRLTPAEELASIAAACALLEACVWSAGEEVALLAADGHRITGGELQR